MFGLFLAQTSSVSVTFVGNGYCVEKLEMRIQNFAFQIELCCRPLVFLKVLSLQLIDDHLDT